MPPVKTCVSASPMLAITNSIHFKNSGLIINQRILADRMGEGGGWVGVARGVGGWRVSGWATRPPTHHPPTHTHTHSPSMCSLTRGDGYSPQICKKHIRFKWVHKWLPSLINTYRPTVHRLTPPTPTPQIPFNIKKFQSFDAMLGASLQYVDVLKVDAYF